MFIHTLSPQTLHLIPNNTLNYTTNTQMPTKQAVLEARIHTLITVYVSMEVPNHNDHTEVLEKLGIYLPNFVLKGQFPRLHDLKDLPISP